MVSFQAHVTPVTTHTTIVPRPLFKYIHFVQVKGQDSLPDVGQPILPCLGVEVRDDFQLSVLHSLTGKEIVTFECFINVFTVQV